jgi:Xaa-Pro aminopeptidase
MTALLPPKLLPQEFADRRKRLLAILQASSSVLILAAYPEARRNADVSYPFRQESNFWYVTGLNEPEAIAVFVPGHSDGDFQLFVHPEDPQRAIWEGEWTGVAGAKRDYGADNAYALADFAKKLPAFLANREILYIDFSEDYTPMPAVHQALASLRRRWRFNELPPRFLAPAAPVIGALRLYKSPAELDCLRHAAAVSAEGHRLVAEACAPGVSEKYLANVFAAHLAQSGLDMAYPSIVAAGGNACILHYREAKGILAAGSLLLIDAGGEYENYAADITRTWPVGYWTEASNMLYQAVLDIQSKIIAMLRPGLPWTQLQETTVQWVSQYLHDFGFIAASPEEIIEKQWFKPFYMHNVGHWLGLDVHDAGLYRTALGEAGIVKLAPGMVFTVEPGLYIRPPEFWQAEVAEANIQVPPDFWNLGVRIEDDVLITDNGAEVLTAAAPKAR